MIGTFRFTNGDVFEGEYVNDMRHGIGKHKFTLVADDDTNQDPTAIQTQTAEYEGEFVEDFRCLFLVIKHDKISVLIFSLCV